ncbi:uncharacterized protein [Primulina huaijiensis]|uniref:uncharacterized protein n=1 Tax=Primulina huaijiensis TaxID=1492673 RepID=UPI003CC74C47
MIQRSPNQTVPPYKNPKKINHPLAYSSFSKFLPSNFQEPGILQAPPPFLSHSCPPFLRPSAQPPLLPLPAAHPRGAASTRGLSCPPINRKTGNYNRTRDSPLTPKMPNSSRKENKISPPKPSDCIIISSTTPLGHHLPKTVARALPLVSPGNIIPDDYKNIETNISDKFSGSVVFAISPPPSSLPFPKFSLKPKLCCKVEAAGINTGATDDLRRLLRLR